MEMSRQRVCTNVVAHDRVEASDSLTEIHALARHEDTHAVE